MDPRVRWAVGVAGGGVRGARGAGGGGGGERGGSGRGGGGVARDEVDPKTLASRKVKGLFFAGEVVDVDGPCGGYNLTWAFASGYVAGLRSKA